MKITLLPLFFSSLLYADLEVSGHLDLDSQVYLTKPSDKNANSFTAKQTLEIKYTRDNLTLYSQVYAQEVTTILLTTLKKLREPLHDLMNCMANMILKTMRLK